MYLCTQKRSKWIDSVYKAKQLLAVLAESSPYTLNISGLCVTLQASRNNVLKLIDLMDKAALVRRLYSVDSGMNMLTKPTKEGDDYGVRWATTLNYELPEIMAVIHQKGSDYMKTMKRLMMTFMALGLAMKESCIGFLIFRV